MLHSPAFESAPLLVLWVYFSSYLFSVKGLFFVISLNAHRNSYMRSCVNHCCPSFKLCVSPSTKKSLEAIEMACLGVNA